jgi:hypothetical protein
MADHGMHGTRKPKSPKKSPPPSKYKEGFKSVEQIKRDILNRPRGGGKSQD